MTPDAIELHMILMLMLIVQFLFQLIITGVVVSTLFDVRSILIKLKIVGEKVSDNCE
jgi:hypothetical protein